MPAVARTSPRPPFLVPEDRERMASPVDLLFRCVAARVCDLSGELSTDGQTNTLRRTYGASPDYPLLQVIERAASGPADTTTSGWALQLVQTTNGAWISSLKPSAFGQLAEAGIKLSFDGGALPRVPGRAATPSIAASFVGEGAPIPFRQMAFNSGTTLTPKKVAVLSGYTSELASGSAPNVEAVLRAEIPADTMAGLDSILLDATAATTVRPAGLRSYGAGLTPTAGGGFGAVMGDLKNLLAAISPAIRPVLIMNRVQALALAQANFGVANVEMLPGVIVAPSVTAGTVIAVDAADFAVASRMPEFTVSTEALLHQEDSLPLPISTIGTPNPVTDPATVAAPARSFYQTDAISLRMTWALNWALRRTNAVAWLAAVTW